MNRMLIVLLVLFVICVAVWAAILLGALAGASSWFALAAVIILGVAVFAAGAKA